MHVTMVICPLT